MGEPGPYMEIQSGPTLCTGRDDVSPELFKIMLEYIYSDSVNISPEDAIELLKIADRFGLNRLKQVTTIYNFLK